MRAFWKAGPRLAARTVAICTAALALAGVAIGCGEKSEPAVHTPSTASTPTTAPTNTAAVPAPTTPAPTSTKPAKKG